MDQEQEKQFAEECAVLLELTLEIAQKYNIHNMTVDMFGIDKGIVAYDFSNIETCSVGFYEPKDKVIITK